MNIGTPSVVATAGRSPVSKIGRVGRIGKRIGGWLGQAANIGTGYLWAKHGFVWAAAFWFGFLTAALAAWGALNFPWRKS